MSGCEFCERLNAHREYAGRHPEYEEEYQAALVIRTWDKPRGKRYAFRTTSYRHRGLGFKLNYCPECGRKIGGNQ